MIDFTSGAPTAGDLDVTWIHGRPARARHDTDPAIQVHAFDPHTFVIRQNMTVHHEAPFIYLFCGNERSLLLDTGAVADPDLFRLRATIDDILTGWLAEHPRPDYGLVVAHTHAHSDHIAADGQFQDRPNTNVVGVDVEAVRSFFGISPWPGAIVTFDLGGRILEITGCPGHHETSIAVYDPWTGFLLTGDTVYPGRLYARDYGAFLDSLDRLVDFAEMRPVTNVMGGHVEMSRSPGRDYPFGAVYQPAERPLEMTVDQLRAVRTAARSVEDRPGAHVFDDFIIFHGPGRRALPKYILRSIWHQLSRRLARLVPASDRPA